MPAMPESPRSRDGARPRPRARVLALAFAVAFLVVGVPYWRIPYAQVSLPDALLTPALLAPFVGAVVAGAVEPRLRRAVLLLGLPVPAVVMARVVVEVLADRSSHNLWPFELVIAAAVGFVVSLAGALPGAVLRRAVRRGDPP